MTHLMVTVFQLHRIHLQTVLLPRGYPSKIQRRIPFRGIDIPSYPGSVQVEIRRTPLNMLTLWTVNVKGLLLAQQASSAVTSSIFHSISGQGKELC